MRSMDSLIVSIAIAVALGLAACGKDKDEPGEEAPSELDRSSLERPPTDGKLPRHLRPPQE